MSLKLIFNNETKKLAVDKNYDALVLYVNKAFTGLPSPFKFYYMDSEGDLISVTQDEDLEEFRENKPSDGLKLYIFGNQKEASLFFSSKDQTMMNETFRIISNNQPQVINMPNSNRNRNEETARDSGNAQNHQDSTSQINRTQESSINYYDVRQSAKPSIEKEDFLTPNDLPERQMSIIGGQKMQSQNLKNHVHHPNEQQNNIASNNMNNSNHQERQQMLQSKLQMIQQEQDMILSQNQFNKIYERDSVDQDSNSMNLVKSEIESDLVVVQKTNSNKKQQMMGYQGSQYDRPINFEELKSEYDINETGENNMYDESQFIENDLINQLNSQKTQTQQVQNHKDGGQDLKQKQTMKTDDFEFEDGEQNVRYIEDSDDDDNRFNSNLNMVGGRANRASTKLIKMDDYSRSNSVLSTDTNTQIKRVETFARGETMNSEQNKSGSISPSKSINNQQEQTNSQIYIQAQVEENKLGDGPYSPSKKEKEPYEYVPEQHFQKSDTLLTIPELIENESSKFEQQLSKKESDFQQVEEQQKLNMDLLQQSMMDEMPCFSCCGKGADKNVPCGLCGGTGKLPQEMLDQVKNIFQEEINNTAPLLVAKLMQNQDDPLNLNFEHMTEDIIHPDTRCYKCGSEPIKGVKYRCFECRDYQICELCEKIDSHADIHAFIKVRRPELDPFQNMHLPPSSHLFIAEQQIQQQEILDSAPIIQEQNKVEEEKKESNEAIFEQQNQSNIFFGSSENCQQQQQQEQKQIVKNLPSSSYKASLVKESFGDKYAVEAGQAFQKIWTFKNDCEHTWPEGLSFNYTNGQLMGEKSTHITKEVKAGDLIDIDVQFTAPNKPGTYITYYKLQFGNNKSFGPKVWCDIQVNEPEDDLARLQREFNQFNVAGGDAGVAQSQSQVIQNNHNPLDSSQIMGGAPIMHQQNNLPVDYLNQSWNQNQQLNNSQMNYGQIPYQQYYSQYGAGYYNQFGQAPYGQGVYQQQNPLGQSQQQYSGVFENQYNPHQQQQQQQNQVNNPYNNPLPNININGGGNNDIGMNELPPFGQVPNNRPRASEAQILNEIQKIDAMSDYTKRCQAMLSADRRGKMLLLLDMGFTDFNKNESALQKNGDKLDDAVMDLMV